eukprot:jgi/Chlat1/6904/Chrsp52S00515
MAAALTEREQQPTEAHSASEDAYGGLSDAVSFTSRLIAACRALEMEAEQPLINDPWARHFAGEKALEQCREMAAKHTRMNPRHIAIRTKYFDDATVAALRGELLCQSSRGPAFPTQVVMLGAGMDARVWRLPEQRREGEGWLAESLFEVDQPGVIAAKEAMLKQLRQNGALSLDPKLARSRVTVAADLMDPAWARALARSGYNSAAPAVWVMEGLLMYLEPVAVDALVRTMAEVSAEGSVFIASVQTEEAIESAQKSEHEAMKQWKFGTNTPEAYFGQRGWSVVSNVPHGSPQASYGWFMEETQLPARTHYVCAMRTDDNITVL